MKQTIRAQRGMVFWFDPAVYGVPFREQFISPINNKEYPSHIQGGNRPYLIVSNNMGNDSSYTCNVVPITLKDKTKIPVHVNFMYMGKPQTILVEQIRTVDIMALGNYIYTLSDDVMIQVDKAIAIQQAIRPSVTYMDLKLESIVDHLRNVVDNIIQEKAQALILKSEEREQSQSVSFKQIEDAALQLGDQLETLLSEVQKPQNEDTPHTEEEHSEQKPDQQKQPAIKSPAKKYEGMSPVEKFNAKYSKTVQSVQKQPKPVKKQRNTWTRESRERFIEDCNRMSPEEVMKKWNLSSISSVFSTKYNCKNALAGLKTTN